MSEQNHFEFLYSKKGTIVCFIIGLLLVCTGIVPFLILQQKSVFPVLDQLDSDVAEYAIKAKHLFDGSVHLPEYFAGSSGEQVIPTSPGTIVFYVFLDVFHAFLTNHILVVIAAFLSMFALLHRITKNALVSAASAVVFAYLPFYSIYGLGVAGFSLVILAFLQLLEDGPKKWIAYINLALYGLFSSLALMGWAASLIYFVATVVFSIRYRNELRKVIGLWIGGVDLAIVYAVTNFPMIQGFFFGIGEESHRSELVFHSVSGNFFRLVYEEMLNDDAHFWAHSCHKYIFIFGIILLFLCLFLWNRIDRHTGNLVKALLGIYAFVLFTSAFAVVFRSEPIVNLRNQYDSSLASFQFDRFFYLYPVLWYVALGLILEILLKYTALIPGWKRLLSFGALACVYLICAFYVLESSIFKNNLRDLIKPEGSTNLSWQGYYSPQQYQDAADFIYNETGKTPDQYRIGNVGLVPAVAIVNGFYTIDGYSSVYSLEYKHRFRPAIAKELEKNEANRQYFDEWGNRCYLFPADYTGNVFLSKYTHASFKDLEFDNEVLKNLGCKYLFAAGEIVNAEEKGYRLVTIIDQYEYTYFLYIYEIL